MQTLFSEDYLKKTNSKQWMFCDESIAEKAIHGEAEVKIDFWAGVDYIDDVTVVFTVNIDFRYKDECEGWCWYDEKVSAQGIPEDVLNQLTEVGRAYLNETY